MRNQINRSYKKEREWAKVVVEKLREARLVAEIGREDLWCMNPLTVVVNAKERGDCV